MAENRVRNLVLAVAKALDDAGVPYAVVGGNAVASWVATVDEGAVRATKDVDITMRRSDLPAASQALRGVGLMPIEVLGVHMFVDRENPNPKTGVHIVIAGERIRAHYQHPAPDVAEAVPSPEGYVVIDLPSLVAMKLQSFRDIDRVHIRDLLSVDLIDSSIVDSLPSDLRERLQDIQRTPE